MTSIVASVRVEIFSDVVCPWCYIGKTRFDAALLQLGAEAVTVVYSPFQLDPTAPNDAPTPVIDAYAKKFGGADKARAILDHVTATAAVDGLSLDLDRALRANTRLAHQLLIAAEDHENSGLQARLYDRLFRGYFCDGDDIGDKETLRGFAREVGMSGDMAGAALDDEPFGMRLDDRLRRAAEFGITAVPTFVIDDKWSIPGAQDVDFFVRTLRRLVESS
jgi:predicted DsbA family dithiol-disulfide isomerase